MYKNGAFTMATILSKELFQKMKDSIAPVRREVVHVTDECDVYVTELTAYSAVEIGRHKADDANAIFNWVAACCVDEDGNPVFTVEDVRNLPSALFGDLARKVMELNALLDSGNKTEEAEKN